MLKQLYYSVRTLLGTDGPGVMNTSRAKKYATAEKMIGPFRSGNTRISIDGRDVSFGELTVEQQERFSVEYIQQMEDAYHAEVVAGDAVDTARKKAP